MKLLAFFHCPINFVKIIQAIVNQTHFSVALNLKKKICLVDPIYHTHVRLITSVPLLQYKIQNYIT